MRCVQCEGTHDGHVEHTFRPTSYLSRNMICWSERVALRAIGQNSAFEPCSYIINLEGMDME